MWKDWVTKAKLSPPQLVWEFVSLVGCLNIQLSLSLSLSLSLFLSLSLLCGRANGSSGEFLCFCINDYGDGTH